MMRTVTIGAKFDLIPDEPTVAFFRLRPAGRARTAEDFSIVDTAGRSFGPEPMTEELGRGTELTQSLDRVVLPAGRCRVSYRADVEVGDAPDAVRLGASAPKLSTMGPDDVWWLQPTRYCHPDVMGQEAWDTFGGEVTTERPATGSVVQAICDHVNTSMTFEYGSSTTLTTSESAWLYKRGVCRDFTHVAIGFCRALNIPARYVFGYLPDIDVPSNPAVQDFCAWFEVLLDGCWWTFDARVNEARVGRVVVGRGRDAADVPIVTTMAAVALEDFSVTASEAGRSVHFADDQGLA